MKIAVDKNQLSGSHGKSNKALHDALTKDGHELVPVPCPFGDYFLLNGVAQDTIDRRGSKLKKMDLVGDIPVSVDRKNSLSEIVGNICNSSHNRFRDEVILAQKCGCKLYILVEEEGINEIRDVFSWVNPRNVWYYRLKKAHENGRMLNRKLPKSPPTKGSTLAKAMMTMEKKYGCEFVFASKKEYADKLIELLAL